MEQARQPQFNIRSRYARDRARQLAEQTGRTTTQIVEEALRVYAPPSDSAPDGTPGPHGLVWRGGILVIPARGKRIITQEEADAALEAARNREDED